MDPQESQINQPNPNINRLIRSTPAIPAKIAKMMNGLESILPPSGLFSLIMTSLLRFHDVTYCHDKLLLIIQPKVLREQSALCK